MLLGAGWDSVLRGGVGQLKADGNIGLAADGLCADPQRGKLQRPAGFFLRSLDLLLHNTIQVSAYIFIDIAKFLTFAYEAAAL